MTAGGFCTGTGKTAWQAGETTQHLMRGVLAEQECGKHAATAEWPSP